MHADSDGNFGADSGRAQEMRQLIGAGIEFTISELINTRDQCDSVGCRIRALAHEILYTLNCRHTATSNSWPTYCTCGPRATAWDSVPSSARLSKLCTSSGESESSWARSASRLAVTAAAGRGRLSRIGGGAFQPWGCALC